MRYIFEGKNYYIAPPICQEGKQWLFRGENLLYSHFSAYPGKGERGKMAMKGKWLYNTGLWSSGAPVLCKACNVVVCT